MDDSARYRELCRQGRATFLREAADAAVVRRRSPLNAPASPRLTQVLGDDADSTIAVDKRALEAARAADDGGGDEIHPLVKKPGAPFSDMITVGRTANNDIVFNDVTISRFHAYFKGDGREWKVCDAGSKNGTTLGGKRLDARKETPLEPGATLSFGDVKVTFYPAAALFDLLSKAR